MVGVVVVDVGERWKSKGFLDCAVTGGSTSGVYAKSFGDLGVHVASGSDGSVAVVVHDEDLTTIGGDRDGALWKSGGGDCLTSDLRNMYRAETGGSVFGGSGERGVRPSLIVDGGVHSTANYFADSFVSDADSGGRGVDVGRHIVEEVVLLVGKVIKVNLMRKGCAEGQVIYRSSWPVHVDCVIVCSVWFVLAHSI